MYVTKLGIKKLHVKSFGENHLPICKLFVILIKLVHIDKKDLRCNLRKPHGK